MGVLGRRALALALVVSSSLGFLVAPPAATTSRRVGAGSNLLDQKKRKEDVQWRRRRDVRGMEMVVAPDVSEMFADVNGGVLVLQGLTSLFASVFGFGDALLAMPLLALVFDMDTSTAAPLVSVVSTAMIAANLAVDAKSGAMERVGRWQTSAAMLAGAVVGVPLGVKALVDVDPDLVRGLVGLVLVGYGAAKLLAGAQKQANAPALASGSTAGRAESENSEDRAARLDLLTVVLPFGFLAGFLGGAVAEPGPPAVVLSQLQKWDPATTRLLLFRFFLPVQVLAIADYERESLFTPFVWHQSIATLPVIALAVALGTKLNRRINPDTFSDIVAAIVVVLGLFCSASALQAILADLLPAAATASMPPGSDDIIAVGLTE